jgi:hypothetical protein
MTTEDMEFIKRSVIEYIRLERQQLDSLPSLDPEEKEIFDKRVFAAFDKYFEERERSKRIKRRVRLLIAAVISISLLVFCISCRKLIRNFIIEVKDIAVDYIGKKEEDIVGVLKESIEEKYVLTYVPDGYREEHSSFSNAGYYSYWINEAGEDEAIVFDQMLISGSHISIDREHVTEKGKKHFEGLDIDYVIIKSDVFMIWEYNGYVFQLLCPEKVGWDTIEKIISNLEETK